MKVALLGNMNNNNFSIMRYFRDLGVDAHLFIFKNDGSGTLAHFVPENDSWELDKWKSFIHYVDIYNGPASVLGNKFPISLLFRALWMRSYFSKRSKKFIYDSVSTNSIKSAFVGFDTFIGSGLSGPLLARIGKSLSLFYPYSMGIEFLGSAPMKYELERPNPLRRLIAKLIAEAQKNAIKNAKNCTTGEMSVTKQTYDEIDVKFTPLAVPMVYNRETLPSTDSLSDKLKSIIMEIEACDLSIIMHGRQFWSNPGSYSESEWKLQSKHNEWLFLSLAKLTHKFPEHDVKLFLLEYGKDVYASKELCKELGIERRIVWLPKMKRKELMLLLSKCDVGAGEFYQGHGVIWGGTGWEVLASGKPLLQGFKFDEGEFERYYGYPPPPMLAVREQDDILRHLLDICINPQKAKDIGDGASKWFDQYNGISLAKKWLDLIETKPSTT
jgi:hypothetical protein